MEEAPTHKQRKTYKTEDVDIDDKTNPAVPQYALPTQSESQDLTAKLMIGLFRMLGKLLMALVPLLPAALVCFFIFNIFRSTVDSACNFPVISSLLHCKPLGDGKPGLNALMDIQSQLVSVQDIGAHSNTLPMQLEYSKNVVREVASIVQYTNIPSRDKIVGHLTEFWQLTDVTGDGIGDFLQGIDRMVDSVITRNEFTLRNLKEIALSRSESQSIGSQVYAVLFHAPLTAEDAARRQYLEHLDRLAGDIDTLILEAQLLDQNLKNMANIQWNIQDAIVGDSVEVNRNYNEVQGRFWTWFGGYQDLLRDYEQQAAVLQGLDLQRKWAVEIVSEVTQTLKATKHKLADLRIRVKEPRFHIGGDMELQIDVIEKGAEALKIGKMKSKKVKQDAIDEIKRQIGH